jgi:tripartite-type tricarboxylate transporter receptor subunit TctC
MPANTRIEAFRARIEAETLRLLASAEMAERIRAQGATSWPRDSPALGAHIRAEHAKFGEVIRTAAIRAE